MTETRECPCSRPATPWLCRVCLTTLRDLIRDAPELLGNVRPVIAKTAKAGPTIAAPGTGSRPPLNLEALEAAEELAALVDVAKAHGLDTMARHEFILTFRTSVEAATRRCRNIVWPPPARAIIGPCTVPDCPGSALAGEGEPEARCDTCGQTYEVRGLLRSRVLGALEGGAPVRAGAAARSLTDAGMKVTTRDVLNWSRDGSLEHVDEETEGRRVYRLYNIADVYAAAVRRSA